MTDATPVSCGTSRETVKRSELAGYVDYGYCASRARYYWGLKLSSVRTGDGMPITWCLVNPTIGEREVVAALLQRNHHLTRTGQILLADKGFAGQGHLAEARGLRLLRPTAQTRPTATATSAGTPVDRVSQPDPPGPLDLEAHGARTLAGVLTRIAQRLLAMATGIWHNWTTRITSKRSLTANDH